MSAYSIRILTIYVPSPSYYPPESTIQAQQVNSSISYSYFSRNVTTLSTNSANSVTDVAGLLYVPELNATDPCIAAGNQYLPGNVTHRQNLPNKEFYLVAVAPWLNSTCALRYMDAARNDPIRGFIFYSTALNGSFLPKEGDDYWATTDGGAWKQENHYPVYGISGDDGALIVTESSRYSGNITSAPYGQNLTELYDPRGYVRLYIDIDTGSDPTFPKLWVFLLIVLGILLAIIALTSLTMHLMQQRRRTSLRRRIVNGEVDLEALGIKRLNVPQQILDEMPIYVYGRQNSAASLPSHQSSPQDQLLTSDRTRLASVSLPMPPPALIRTNTYQPTHLSQPTCAICLEDFLPSNGDEQGTVVRELPCLHIFHPECVDIFLRDSSSLCPMCKKSALPRGYCPRIVTNAMVRRERMLRRLRERVNVEHDADDDSRTNDSSSNSGRPDSVASRMRARARARSGFRNIGRRTDSGSSDSQPMRRLDVVSGRWRPSQQPTYLQTVTEAPEHTDYQSQPLGSRGRREWARQRAIAMLGGQAPSDPDAEDDRDLSAWRRALRSIFPATG